MTPELIAHIFELFTQGDFAKERKLGGLGVGLSLVKTLVELHGGSISVDSAGADKGARFTVRLPLTSESAYQAGVSKLEPGADNVPHRRILLVDDDLDAVESMRLLLEMSGHEVYVVNDGARAIEAAQRLAPDMALIDIGLPGLSGHEVAKQIRRDRNGDKIVLAALTGYGTDEDRKQSREAGFDYHLVKPLAFDDLQSLLSDTTPKQRTGH